MPVLWYLNLPVRLLELAEQFDTLVMKFKALHQQRDLSRVAIIFNTPTEKLLASRPLPWAKRQVHH